MKRTHLGGKINYLSRQILHAVDERLQKEGLTFTNLHILGILAGAERVGGKVCQRDLEEKVCIRASSVTNLLQNLERNEWIVRYAEPGNGRTKYVRLTDAGKAMAERGKLVLDELDDILCEGFSEEEEALFFSFLDRSIENLK